MPTRRVLLGVPLVLLALLLVVAAGVYLWFDPNAYKDRIEAAVEKQTGRKLVLAGPLRLTLVPAPALEADDVSFANAAGGSRPEMVTAKRVQAEFAWWPLLHRQIAITRLTLINPDFLLEREADGSGNWQMSQLPPNQAPPDNAQPSAPSGQKPPPVLLQGLRLVDGTLTWHGARTLVLAVRQADLDETDPDAPITLAGSASLAGTAFTLAGKFGPLSRLRDAAASGPWPVKLSATAEGAAIDIDGTLAEPRTFGGYDFAVSATASDLGLVRPLFPGVTLPAFRDMRVKARIAAGKPWPVVSELVMHAGPSDLDATVPGLKLAKLDIEIPGPDKPMHGLTEGVYAGSPMRIELSGGTPASLLPGGSDTAFPVDASAVIAGAKLAVKGELAHPRTRTGLAADVFADIPDLTALAPLTHRDLPALQHIVLAAKISDRDGLDHGISFRDLRLGLPQGDLTGDVTVDLLPRPAVQGKLTGKRLDVDALRAAWPARPTSSAPEQKPEPVATSRFVIPDTRFAFNALHRGDADLHLALGELVVGGVTYREIDGHLLLRNGHLLVDPVAARLPAGAAAGRLDIDASASPARIAFVLHSPGLALKPLLTEFQVPDDAAGVLQVEADLRGSGDTPHDVASDINGTLGLSMVGGSIDDRLLGATFGELLRTVKLPGSVGNGGRAEVRCFALRLDAENGVAAVRAMLIDVSRLRVTGSGTIDLGRETLALRLRPFVKIAGTGLVVPLHVGGTFRKPRPAVDPAGAPEAAASLAVDLANKGAMISGVTSALAAEGEKLLGEADTGDCGPALALARDGKPGPDPAPQKPDKSAPVVNDLLKKLFK